MDLGIKLGPNFTLLELLDSQIAQRHPDIWKEQMNPPECVVGCLQNLVTHCIQVARTEIGFPIMVSSGWRCPSLNEKVGSEPTSQHLKGQAADLVLPRSFLASKEPGVLRLRQHIERRVQDLTGAGIRQDVGSNFYLWAYLVLNRERLRIDQVIHEFGSGPGQPGWIHVSSVPGSVGRQKLTALGGWVKNSPRSVEEALSYGT